MRMNPILNPLASNTPEKNGSPGAAPSRRVKPDGRELTKTGVTEPKPITARSGMRLFCKRINGAMYAGISSAGSSDACFSAAGVGYLPTTVKGSPDFVHGIAYISVFESGRRNTTVEVSGTLGACGITCCGRVVNNDA